jgi:hypothetical protein
MRGTVLAIYNELYGSETVCPDNTLDSAMENFRQLYMSITSVFSYFHKGKKCSFCTSTLKTAVFLKVARALEGNAEFGDISTRFRGAAF